MLKGLAAFAAAFVLSMTTLPGSAGYRHGHYHERYRHPLEYGFSGYFRPFGGSYGGYYGGYFGAGSDTGFDGYNPCGLGRSVLEGCRRYRGY